MASAVAAPDASAQEDIPKWRKLFNRTVVVHTPAEGRPYTDESVVAALRQRGLAEEEVQCVGLLEGGRKWQVRLSTEQRANELLTRLPSLRVQCAPAARIGFVECPVTAWHDSPTVVRVHWLPNFVGLEYLPKILARYGL